MEAALHCLARRHLVRPHLQWVMKIFPEITRLLL